VPGLTLCHRRIDSEEASVRIGELASGDVEKFGIRAEQRCDETALPSPNQFPGVLSVVIWKKCRNRAEDLDLVDAPGHARIITPQKRGGQKGSNGRVGIDWLKAGTPFVNGRGLAL